MAIKKRVRKKPGPKPQLPVRMQLATGPVTATVALKALRGGFGSGYTDAYNRLHPKLAAINAKISNRQTAIVARCLMCTVSKPEEGLDRVRECEAVTCPLWSFRLGTNPLHRKSG